MLNFLYVTLQTIVTHIRNLQKLFTNKRYSSLVMQAMFWHTSSDDELNSSGRPLGEDFSSSKSSKLRA
ncbi:hypothetical protein HanRHA438_Chr09g0408511 [Helianthus annuus]|nr:hypothetical protein HanRHA438_Chr09g0408511 [Helianthus annuus]